MLKSEASPAGVTCCETTEATNAPEDPTRLNAYWSSNATPGVLDAPRGLNDPGPGVMSPRSNKTAKADPDANIQTSPIPSKTFDNRAINGLPSNSTGQKHGEADIAFKFICRSHAMRVTMFVANRRF